MVISSDDIHDLLEKNVIPEFYKKDENGLNKDWLQWVRRSMTKLTFAFSPHGRSGNIRNGITSLLPKITTNKHPISAL
jgi:hypothetical protein